MKLYDKKRMLIDRFDGPFMFLSNFWEQQFAYKGRLFKTSEHAYQSYKTQNSRDFERVMNASGPGSAKRIGQFVKLRDDWDDVKLGIMLEILRAKFDLPDLAGMLVGTGNAILIEGNNWHDNYWGNCTCEKCRSKNGENFLGLLLMRVRSTIQNEEKK